MALGTIAGSNHTCPIARWAAKCCGSRRTASSAYGFAFAASPRFTCSNTSCRRAGTWRGDTASSATKSSARGPAPRWCAGRRGRSGRSARADRGDELVQQAARVGEAAATHRERGPSASCTSGRFASGGALGRIGIRSRPERLDRLRALDVVAGQLGEDGVADLELAEPRRAGCRRDTRRRARSLGVRAMPSDRACSSVRSAARAGRGRTRRGPSCRPRRRAHCRATSAAKASRASRALALVERRCQYQRPSSQSARRAIPWR